MTYPSLLMRRILPLGLLCLLTLLFSPAPRTSSDSPVAVIVQGSSVSTAQAAVEMVGGTMLQPLTLINAVSAQVPASAIARLERAGVTVTPDRAVRSSSSPTEDDTAGLTLYPSAAAGVQGLLSQNIEGFGVTVAVVDSGFPEMDKASWTTKLDSRTLKSTDASGAYTVYRDLLYTGPQLQNSSDPYGHGTHIVMTIADKRKIEQNTTYSRVPVGVAPGVNLVVVRALDANGRGNYSTVIAAIDWIVANRTTYNIRVLNLSLDGPPAAPYWKDPLGQAVMRAWQSGIVVVASAGNSGPAPMSIGVPGNVPYIITVGAIKSGRYTDSGHDELATYSAAGPTESKFVKPDVLVPASRTISVLPRSATLASSGVAALYLLPTKNNATHPKPVAGKLNPNAVAYYMVSGTSMAAAEVSGIVALMLQQNPSLTPDQVKYRLTSTAQPAGSSADALYSVWQQGAGRVRAEAAVGSTSTTSANAGMDISLDLLAEQPGAIHYVGNTAYDPLTHSFYFAGEAVGAGDYQSWAGDYQSWAGDYQSWAGDYQSWAGDYQSWAGDYQSWAGDYYSWAGDYYSWAGDYQSWAGDYQSWAGNLINEQP